MLKLNVEQLLPRIGRCDAFRTVGKLRSAKNMLSASLPAAIGDLCEIGLDGGQRQLAEVIGFDRGIAQILPFESIDGLHADAYVVGLDCKRSIPTGRGLLGRVLDGLGRPVDGLGKLHVERHTEPLLTPPSALIRRKISEPFSTGQRAIDSMLTLGHGQRVGLFAGSGVGKSTLLGEIAKGASSDVNVIALIGERGREVRPFLDDCLGKDGRRRSVTIVSTADQTPLMRVRAAETAVAIAADFREQGANVLFLLDSTTRIAFAQREIGLQLGEPPSSRGYTPSVFQVLARLLEQLGTSDKGSITSIVTVLVDGDDMDEPIADAVRSIVDGHVVLDRHLAEKAHFPAINVGRSISRVFRDVTTPEHQEAANKLRALMATYDEVADLIRVGAYEKGSSTQIDTAVRLMPVVNTLLQQRPDEHTRYEDTEKVMTQIAAAWPF
ncbi:MAG: FliI/YscN family ATPase [Planctomycetales bacterium]|nr:FliI/YscN family ATPase [Planctomycetales bacterium]